MLDKSDVKAFFRFTEEASNTELLDKAAFFLQALGLLDEGDMKADYRFLLRIVREEQIARLQVRLCDHAAQQRDAERRKSGSY